MTRLTTVLLFCPWAFACASDPEGSALLGSYGQALSVEALAAAAPVGRATIADDLRAPGEQPALCCASCGPSQCQGCVNIPWDGNCHGEILACPGGEVLTDDGAGSCADADAQPDHELLEGQETAASDASGATTAAPQTMKIVQPPPSTSAVDHSDILLMLQGCTCISPHCVAYLCPADVDVP